MGPIYNKQRVLHSVRSDTTTFKKSDLLPSSRQLAPTVIEGRSAKSVGKRSHRTRTGSFKPRVLQQAFPSSKKERKIKTCNRPFSIEQNDTGRSFSNGNNRLCTQGHRARVLGGVHRFNGRLPTHTHSEGLKEVSPFHSGRRSLPVPFPSVRNFYGPSGVHEFDGNRGSVYQTARSKTDPVFRRLAESQTVKGGIDDRPQYSLEVNYSTRSNPKHGKIGTRSVPGFCVHRYELPHRPGNCEGPRRQSKQHSLSPFPTLCEDGHNGSKVSVPIGYSELNSGPGGSREVAYETSSVSSTFEMEAPCGQPRTGYPFRPTVFISPQMVDESKHLHEGRSVAGAQAGLSHIHRRKSCGLGCPHRTTRSVEAGTLVQGGQRASYQQSRNEGCVPCIASLVSPDKWLLCDDSFRQHNSGFVSKKAGGDPFAIPVHGSVGNPYMVSDQENPTENQAHSRQIQCHRRQPQSTKQNSSDRMVDLSDSPRSNFLDLGKTDVGPVCDSIQQQTTNVCVSSSGSPSLGSGCILSRVETPVRLRVPTIQNDSTGSEQNQERRLHNNPDSTCVAPAVMVQQPSGTCDGKSDSTSMQRRSPVSSAGHSISSQHRNAPPSRLEIIRESIRDREFSEYATSCISNAKRESTNKVYSLKWKKFCHWCSEREVNPVDPPIHAIADFLSYLFREEKASVSTIKGYRSAISNTLKFSVGPTIGSDPFISDLIRNFDIQRPVTKSLTPKWNLTCVLWSLCKGPYEPLDSASLDLVTYKTAFLLAFATSRRRSELHALSVEEGHLRFDKQSGSVSLLTQPGFLAKNRLPSVAPSPIVVPSLSKTCGKLDKDRLLCPVRSLKFYLKKVESRRNGRKRLFLPIKGVSDISPATISRWICRVIRKAYESLSKSDLKLMKVTAHEVRALSSSWAYLNAVSLDDVMRAAYWHSESTFSSFYLRSLSSQVNELRSLGPLVAAQAVTGRRA